MTSPSAQILTMTNPCHLGNLIHPAKDAFTPFVACALNQELERHSATGSVSHANLRETTTGDTDTGERSVDADISRARPARSG